MTGIVSHSRLYIYIYIQTNQKPNQTKSNQAKTKNQAGILTLYVCFLEEKKYFLDHSILQQEKFVPLYV